MRRGLRGLAAIGMSVVGLAAIGPGVALAGTLDQQQTERNGSIQVASGFSDAQTFTAGLSGGVDRIDLLLLTEGTITAPLSVEIRDVSGSAPGTVVLASQSVPASSIPSIPSPAAFVPINFATPAPVVAGTQYAIVAYSATSTGSGNDGYYWGAKPNSNPYPAGEDFTTMSPPPSFPTGWTGAPNTDNAFKTYVVVPPTSASGPTGLRAAALKKCKKKHSHKAKKKCKKKANLLPV